MTRRRIPRRDPIADMTAHLHNIWWPKEITVTIPVQTATHAVIHAYHDGRRIDARQVALGDGED